MSVDNRTELNDCETNAGWTGDGSAPGAVALAGQFYQGSNSIGSQHTNADEHMSTTTETVGDTTYSLSAADMTFYLMLKDNLAQSLANGGIQFVLADGTDKVGFDIGGNNAVGLSLSPFFNTYKLDASNLPAGSNITYSGIEGNLTLGTITEVGIGTIHSAKAQGNVQNIFIDYLSYIANDSFALTINGGTVGTPETMADVQGDDVTNGWGMLNNPVGTQYGFFAPTEWGNVSTIAGHYFTADGEQWYWIGDNAGGHAVGASHFPFQLVSNTTDTGLWVVSNTVIVNTGTRAEFDMSDANFDTIEMDGCSLTGLGAISLPSLGGTSRFTTNNIFNNCAQITHNGADLSGSKVLESAASAGSGAVLYNETADPDLKMGTMLFTKGVAAHSAIEFGTAVTADITLTNVDFTGFGSTDDVNGAVFKFLAASGSLNLNLKNCTTDGTFSVDDSAGITVTVVVDPVATTVTVTDPDAVDLQNALVYLKAKDGTGPLPYQDSVTIARAGAVATVTHAAHAMITGDLIVIKGITDNTKDNAGTHAITFIDAGSYSYVTIDEDSTSYTGTITATWVALAELTTAGGVATVSRSYGSNQPVDGWVRKSSASPRLKTFPISGIIISSAGLSINVQMISDE